MQQYCEPRTTNHQNLHYTYIQDFEARFSNYCKNDMTHLLGRLLERVQNRISEGLFRCCIKSLQQTLFLSVLLSVYHKPLQLSTLDLLFFHYYITSFCVTIQVLLLSNFLSKRHMLTCQIECQS